jgi:cytochrome P450
VFGLEQGRQLDAVRDALAALLGTGARALELLWTLPAMTWTGPARRRVRQQELADRLIFELVEHRRRRDVQGDDVLSLLLSARHEDGSPLSEVELRDELVTTLVAGHETTASQLAWAVAILARMPALTGALSEELDHGPSEALLKATIQEIMRLRPVLPNAEQPPGTYTWLPFGAGRRRCIGASFAMVEMQSLLGAALIRFSLAPTGPSMEGAARRGITITPRRQGTVVLRSRSSPRAAAELAAMPAAA